MTTFRKQLRDLINCESLENNSDTPDFILADYLFECLKIFDITVNKREQWYGRHKTEFKTELLQTLGEQIMKKLQEDIPTPKKGEEQDDFHSRCMSAIWDTCGEKDQDKANAICFDAWRSKKEKSKIKGKTMKENNETFKCPECGSKVLVNTGYCMKCKKKVKPKKKENYEIHTYTIWPIITISLINDEFEGGEENFQLEIDEAKMYLQGYGFQFNEMQDVVYTDGFTQIIEVATALTKEQAKKLINDAEWVDNLIIYLPEIMTEITFVDKKGISIRIDMLESKIEKNITIEKNDGFSILIEGNKLEIGDTVEMSNSGIIMYGDKYKDKIYTIKGIIEDRGFSRFELEGLPFTVEVLDVKRMGESKEIIFVLEDNVRIGGIILEKDERIKIETK